MNKIAAVAILLGLCGMSCAQQSGQAKENYASCMSRADAEQQQVMDKLNNRLALGSLSKETFDILAKMSGNAHNSNVLACEGIYKPASQTKENYASCMSRADAEQRQMMDKLNSRLASGSMTKETFDILAGMSGNAHDSSILACEGIYRH